MSSPPLDLRPISIECWAFNVADVAHDRCTTEGCACACHPNSTPECAEGLHSSCTHRFRDVDVPCDCPCHLFEFRALIVQLWRRAVAA